MHAWRTLARGRVVRETEVDQCCLPGRALLHHDDVVRLKICARTFQGFRCIASWAVIRSCHHCTVLRTLGTSNQPNVSYVSAVSVNCFARPH